MKKFKYLLRVIRKEFWYWQIRMAWRYTRPLGRGIRSFPTRLHFIYEKPDINLFPPSKQVISKALLSMETGDVVDFLIKEKEKELCQTHS